MSAAITLFGQMNFIPGGSGLTLEQQRSIAQSGNTSAIMSQGLYTAPPPAPSSFNVGLSPGSITFIPPGGRTATPGADNTVSSGQPQKYMINNQDCLWNLSGTFLHDVWSWKKIWDLNPYVQNPDLIYPGDSLILPGYVMASGGTYPSSIPPLPKRSFEEETAGYLDSTAMKDSSQTGTNTPIAQRTNELAESTIPFLSQKVFTPEFLAMVPYLWFSKDARGEIAPGTGRIVPASDRREFQQFDNVTVRPLVKGSIFTVGDTLEILRSERTVYFKKTPGVLVRRVGYARVDESGPEKTLVTLFKIWDVIKAGDRVAAFVPFKGATVREIENPQITLTGTVFQRSESSLFPYIFQSFIIDRGSRDGVQLGDIFLSFPSTLADKIDKPAHAPALVAGTALVSENSSTLVILRLLDKTLSPGDSVTLIKRVQFNAM